MTATLPEAGPAVDGLPVGTGDPVANDSAVPELTLAALAAAYASAQWRIRRNTQAAARDVWLRSRPVTDADLEAWMVAYDRILSGAAAQQAQLTAAYSRAQLARFGVDRRPPLTVTPTAEQVAKATTWLQSEWARVPALRVSVSQVLDAAAAGPITVSQAALIDRVDWLHSPVLKQRWHLSEGVDFDVALEDVVSPVEDLADTMLREVERLSMADAGWPSFKNGTAMLYKRVPQAGACGWCRAVATRLYSVESFRKGSQWHARCHCTWRKVTFAEAKGWRQDPGWRDYVGEGFDRAAWEAAGGGAAETFTQAEQDARAASIERRKAGQRRPSKGTGGRGNAPGVVTLSAAQQAELAVLDARGRDLQQQALAAAQAGRRSEAQRLYAQAREFTTRAYRIRTGQ